MEKTIENIKCFDRSFNFNLFTGYFPKLIERLFSTPGRLEGVVSLISLSILTRSDSDNWSIQENVGHLLDLEPLWLGLVGDILDGEPKLREYDPTNRQTNAANHNEKPIQKILMNFRAARLELVNSVANLDRQILEKRAIHPSLGRALRIVDLMYFVTEHDEHHLAQIEELWQQSNRTSTGE